MTERIYVIEYECKIEPLYSRTAKVSVGIDAEDAIKKLFPTQQEKESHIILNTTEFRIPGYKISLEKLV